MTILTNKELVSFTDGLTQGAAQISDYLTMEGVMTKKNRDEDPLGDPDPAPGVSPPSPSDLE